MEGVKLKCKINQIVKEIASDSYTAGEERIWKIFKEEELKKKYIPEELKSSA